MKRIDKEVEGVCIIEPRVFGDSRGYFMETWSTRNFEEIGLNVSFIQDNQSFTQKKGTIRGIHFQQNPMAQAKLVRVVTGAVMDYAVDLRKGSPTYRKWVCAELSADNKRQFYIPQGFGHAFITLTDDVTFVYRCDNHFSKECDRGIRYDDPSIGIDWGTDNVFLSEKDIKSPWLDDSDCNFVFQD
ncbi:dTDP-4-dehydrorhamnose 3,5-epimerase [Gottschalkiaceae bacterium SANA]|nr:dTDP-4-dehydrorhamnose 3,5-epimerase [Gottschalkiaceae bacterium SANA]